MREVEELVLRLKGMGYHISTAESATGGLIAATIVSVANASSVMDEAFVTYAEKAKIKYLGVSKETIEKYGVVSKEVAKEMVVGLCDETASEAGISITGVAGPTSDGINPVGRICFGFKLDKDVYTITHDFGDLGRNVVRQKACEFAIHEMLQLVVNKK